MVKICSKVRKMGTKGYIHDRIPCYMLSLKDTVIIGNSENKELKVWIMWKTLEIKDF